MRILVLSAIALFVFPTASQACTAGGVPCDQVYREQLKGIDDHRIQNEARQEQIEQQQHRNNMARIQREKELREAQQAGKTTPPQSPPIQTQPIQQPTTSAGMSAECRAYPALCSAYK